MDMTEAIAPRSDQMNADDLLSGPRTFTIREVKPGNDEHKAWVVLDEFPHDRPWKPAKTVLRLLTVAWGKDSKTWVGQRVTLFREPSVKYGGAEVGGIRVSHISGISKRLTTTLTVAQNKRTPHSVDPLPDAPTGPTLEQVNACTDTAELRAMWQHADEDMRTAITARVAELQGGAA